MISKIRTLVPNLLCQSCSQVFQFDSFFEGNHMCLSSKQLFEEIRLEEYPDALRSSVLSLFSHKDVKLPGDPSFVKSLRADISIIESDSF